MKKQNFKDLSFRPLNGFIDNQSYGEIDDIIDLVFD